MPSPDGSFNLSGRVYGGSATSIGNLMVADGTGFYVVATAANRATLGRTQAIATSNWGGVQSGTVSLQFVGTCDSNLPNVGVGAAGRWVRCSTAGAFEVFTPTNGGSSDVVGCANAAGVVTMLFGVLTETMLVGGGGGAGTPGGTNGQFQINSAGSFGGVSGNASGGPLIAPAALVAGDIYYATSTSALARLPKGADGQVLTLVSGLPAWVTSGAAFDFASLALSGYWKDYASLPFVGSASNGTSATRSLVAGVAPSVGINFGTHPSMGFNGTTQYVVCGGTGGGTLNDLITASAYFVQVDFQVTTLPATSGSIYGDGILVGTSPTGVLSMSLSTSGIRAGHFDGAHQQTTSIACSTGVKHCAQMWFDGTTLRLRLDGGTAVAVPAGAVSPTYMGDTLRHGCNYNASMFLTGYEARVTYGKFTPTLTQLDNMRADSVAGYGTV